MYYKIYLHFRSHHFVLDIMPNTRYSKNEHLVGGQV